MPTSRRRLPAVLSPALRHYHRSWLAGDVASGITVAAITVPAALGYAQVAGLPAVTGLYAAMAAMVVFGLFASSRRQVVGPDASLSAMVAAVLAAAALGDPGRALALAPLLGLVVGGLFVVMGLSRLGFLANFLSRPMLAGFTAGLAVEILAGQLPKMLGLDVDAQRTLPALADTVRQLGEADGWSVALAGGAVATMVVLRRFAPRVPGALVVLVAGIVAATVLDLAGRGVDVLGAVPRGIPRPSLPTASWDDVRTLVPGALSLVLIGFASQAVDARTWASRGRHDVDANRDLLALGAANVAGALGGGYPVTSSSSRTAAAVDAGGRTPLLSIVAGALVALVLVVLAPLLEDLPEAVLGAIVAVAVVGLVDVAALRRLGRHQPVELGIALVTMAAVIVLGVLPGVAVAVVLSLLDVVRRASYPHDAVLGRRPGREGFFDTGRAADAATEPGLLVYRFDAPLFFANAERFRVRLGDLVAAADPPVRWVVIDAAAITDVDATATEVLARVLDELGERGITVAVARGTARLNGRLVADDPPLVDGALVFKTLGEAVAAFHAG
jgi:SulP family sulfate permease